MVRHAVCDAGARREQEAARVQALEAAAREAKLTQVCASSSRCDARGCSRSVGWWQEAAAREARLVQEAADEAARLQKEAAERLARVQAPLTTRLLFPCGAAACMAWWCQCHAARC